MKYFKFRHYHILLFLYFSIVTVVFYKIALPSINGEMPIRIWADSYSYVIISKNLIDLHNLISIGGNYLGPYLLLEITNFNHEYIFLINCMFLFFSLILIFSNYNINRTKFTILLLTNPMLFVSLLLVNKEIIGVFSLALLASYLKNKKLLYLSMSLIFSLLTRWQESMVIIIFIIFNKKGNFKSKLTPFFLIMLILIIGTVFSVFSDSFSFINETSYELLESQKSQAFGLLAVLNKLQEDYLYFIAFIPKALLNMIGNITQIFSIQFYQNRIDDNDYYSLFVLFHQMWMFLVWMFLLFFRKLSLRSDLLIFVIIYTVIFSLNLFVQYRYFFPLIVIMCLIFFERKTQIVARC